MAIRAGWTPNTITIVSLIVGLAAAASFATGSAWCSRARLMQLSLLIDCVDGEVARATGRFSSLWAWLDAATDRVKEFAVYAGLAIGAGRNGDDVWWVAIALIVLQTSRHMSDYDFARIQKTREAQAPRVDIRDPSDPLPEGEGRLAGAVQVSARVNRRSAIRWMKKILHMPIGERWLMLSVLSVVAGPRWALIGLLIAGGVALTYVAIGRIVRSLTWSGRSAADGVASAGSTRCRTRGRRARPAYSGHPAAVGWPIRLGCPTCTSGGGTRRHRVDHGYQHGRPVGRHLLVALLRGVPPLRQLVPITARVGGAAVADIHGFGLGGSAWHRGDRRCD